MRRRGIKRGPMTWPERGQHSRDEMERRELRAVERGEHVTYPGAPRRATVRRRLANPDVRERYAAALERYRVTTVEAAIAAADHDAARLHGHRKVAAMKRQVTARTQWLRLIARANPEDGDRPRGIPEGGIAILERACDEMMANAENASPSVAVEEESADDAPPLDSASFPRKRESSSFEKETLDPRVRGGDENEQENVDSRASLEERHSQNNEPGATGSRPDDDKEENDERKNPPAHDTETQPARPAPPEPPRTDRYGNVLDPPDAFTIKWLNDDLRPPNKTMADHDPFDW